MEHDYWLEDEKAVLLIDGANFWAMARNLAHPSGDVDYKRLRAWFAGRMRLLRAYYFTALLTSGEDEFSPLRPLIDWLDYNGYQVITKPTKEFTDSNGRRKTKGNMDMEIAVTAMQFAGKVDHVILASGDGDFRCLVEALQQHGIRVTVLSTLATNPPMVADELRRQADYFLDLNAIMSDVARVRQVREAAA